MAIASQLTYRDVRTILTLLEHWPDGHLRFVDGELSVEALLGADRAPTALGPAGEERTIPSPAVGLFRVRPGRAADGAAVIGVVVGPRRETPVEAGPGDGEVVPIVADGAFVEYGQPIAVLRSPGSGSST